MNYPLLKKFKAGVLTKKFATFCRTKIHHPLNAGWTHADPPLDAILSQMNPVSTSCCFQSIHLTGNLSAIWLDVFYIYIFRLITSHVSLSSAVCHHLIFVLLLSFQIQIFSCSQTPSFCVLTLRLVDQVVNPHLTALFFHDVKSTAATRKDFFCYLPLGTVWRPTSLDSSKVQFFRWSREYILRKYAAVRRSVVKGCVFS